MLTWTLEEEGCLLTWVIDLNKKENKVIRQMDVAFAS